MKVKVINLKNVSVYFFKIGMLVTIAMIFGKFFYNNRGVNASLKVDSSKFASILNKEISLFGNQNKSKFNAKESQNNYSYSKNTVDSEFELIKIATNQNLENVNSNFANYSNDLNYLDASNASNIDGEKINNNTIQTDENATIPIETVAEPEVRSKH